MSDDSGRNSFRISYTDKSAPCTVQYHRTLFMRNSITLKKKENLFGNCLLYIGIYLEFGACLSSEALAKEEELDFFIRD